MTGFARGGPVNEPRLGEAAVRRRLQVAEPPRLALSPDEAAQAIGVSRDFFDEHVAPELRIVRRSRRKIIDVRELQRWLDESATVTLDVERPRRGSDG